MKQRRRRIRTWTWARRATAGTFLTLLVLGCFHWFPWFKGSTTSTRLFDVVPLADPLAAVEVMLATRGWQSSLVIGAGLLLGFAVLMGPVFCGWICPLGLLLDLNHGLRERVRRWFGRRKRQANGDRIPSTIKYAVLGFVLGTSLIAQVPAFQIVSPINIVAWSLLAAVELAREAQSWPTAARVWGLAASLGPALLLVIGIALADYLSPRLWCRALCPLGALYGLVGRFGLLRIRVNSDAPGRAACRQCTVHCPAGIRVMEDYTLAGKSSIDHPDCTRCGNCIDACPRGVLKLGFGHSAAAEADRDATHGCPACGGRGGKAACGRGSAHSEATSLEPIEGELR